MSSFSTITVIYTIATSISRPTQSKKQLRKQSSNQFRLQLLFTQGFFWKQKGSSKKKNNQKTKTLFVIGMLKYKSKVGSLMSIKRVEVMRLWWVDPGWVSGAH